MSFSTFDDILIRTVSERASLLLSIFFITLILTIIKVIYYLRTKDNKGFSIIEHLSGRTNGKPRRSTKEQIGRHLVALLIIVLYLIYWIRPVYRDLNLQQYSQVHGEYKRTKLSSKRSESNLFSNGKVSVYVDGKRLDLELPADWTTEEYPLGEFTGTVWYSQETKIILSFHMD